MAKCVTRDKRILNRANGDYVQIVVFFHWRKHDAQIDPAGPQRGNRFRRRCRDGTDADLGIILMELLQIREQEKRRSLMRSFLLYMEKPALL